MVTLRTIEIVQRVVRNENYLTSMTSPSFSAL